MSTSIERLNESMPSKLARETAEYLALFGDERNTSLFDPSAPDPVSAHFNYGALANEIEYLLAYIGQVAESLNLSDAVTDTLDDMVNFFLGLPRIEGETDAMYINRASVFLRKGSGGVLNESWGTSWSIHDALLFVTPPGSSLYIEENFIDVAASGGAAVDLFALTDGEFDMFAGGAFTHWTSLTSGSSTVGQNSTIPFTSFGCCELSVDASGSAVGVQQLLAAPTAGNQKLCWWYQDTGCPGANSMYVTLERADSGYQWNAATNAWQAAPVKNYFPTTGDTLYHYGTLPWTSPGAVNVMVTFGSGTVGPSAYTVRIDRVQCGIPCGAGVLVYPSVKVMLIVAALGSGSTLYFNPIPGADNIIDRGECESATPPAMTGETTNTLTNCTFARDAAQFYWGTYSRLLTVSAATASAYLQAALGTTSMHGLVAGTQYTFAARVRIPASGGIAPGNISLAVGTYYSGTWHYATQALTTAVADGNWYYFFLTTTLDAATTGVEVGFQVTGATATQYANFDDIRIFAGPNYDSALMTGLSDSTTDQSFWGGDGGLYSAVVYNSLLQMIKPAGVKAFFETIAL